MRVNPHHVQFVLFAKRLRFGKKLVPDPERRGRASHVRLPGPATAQPGVEPETYFFPGERLAELFQLRQRTRVYLQPFFHERREERWKLLGAQRDVFVLKPGFHRSVHFVPRARVDVQPFLSEHFQNRRVRGGFHGVPHGQTECVWKVQGFRGLFFQAVQIVDVGWGAELVTHCFRFIRSQELQLLYRSAGVAASRVGDHGSAATSGRDGAYHASGARLRNLGGA
mmetsp:Transcript_3471/g.12823  ORF Transcript_3471/g.12823 Transcript_3471/m.12823 type:complete len:225 (+) Transcript_3471:804-1478(+)